MRRLPWFLVVALGSAAAHAAPTLIDDHAVDAVVLSAPALLDQQQIGVATDGAGAFFAVWREGDKTADQSTATWSLRGSRLSMLGALLDDPPLTIASGVLQTPAVAYDGASFVVVWQDVNAFKIDGVKVSTAGVVGAPFVLGSGIAGVASAPAVAGGGGYALTVWNKNTSNQTLRGTLLGPSGVVGTADFAISAAASGHSQLAPSVGWSGGASGFLVAWQDAGGSSAPQNKILGATVAQNAAVTALTAAVNSGTVNPGASDPTITSDGAQYLVGWQDTRGPSGYPNLYLRAISFLGVPGAPEVQTAIGGFGTDFFVRPQLAAATVGSLMVWEDLGADGTARLTGGRYLPSGAASPEGVTGVALTDLVSLNAGILPNGGVDSRRGAIASDGSHALAVWTMVGDPSRITGDDVFATPVDLTASTLGSAASALLSMGVNLETSAKVASNGSTFVVVWADDRNALSAGFDVYAMRYDPTGAPIDQVPLLLSYDLADASHLTGARGDQFLPSVSAAQNGGDFLVVWSDAGPTVDASCPSNCSVTIAGTRLGPTGAPQPLASAYLSPNAASAQLSPTVAASGSGWLVAWEDWRDFDSVNSVVVPGIYAVPVSAAGTVGTEVGIAVPNDNLAKVACAPSLAWDGTHYVIAYEQPCSQLVGQFYAIFATNPPSTVLGAWLASDGSIVGTGFPIASTNVIESAPALASDGAGKVYAVWREQTGGTGDAIVAATFAFGQASFSSKKLATGGQGQRLAPAITVGGGSVLVSYVDTLLASTTKPGASALRLDLSLSTLDDVFPLVAAPTWVVAGIEPASSPANGISVASQPRSTGPVALAASASGEALAAYALIEAHGTITLPRIHTRALGLGGNGLACTGVDQCADHICTGGTCCNTACDGVCQACGQAGCVATPPSDLRCDAAPISCASLSTLCRTFAAQSAGRCVAFGQCAEAGEAGECAQHTDAPNGTACTVLGCVAASTCSAGECVCNDALPTHAARVSPPGSGGCSYGGQEVGAGPLALFILACFALLERKRRRVGALVTLVMAVAAASACGSSGTELVLELKLVPAVFVATSTARVVLRSTDGHLFPEADPSEVTSGLTVSNYDYDEDGAIDIVLDFAAGYPFHQAGSTEDKTNRLRIKPSSVTQPIHLDVVAEVFDALQNRLARDEASPILTPGQSTAQALQPRCVDGGACQSSTLQLTASAAAMTAPPLEVAPALGRIRALATGDLTGSLKAGTDLVVTLTSRIVSGASNPGVNLNTGTALVYFGAAGHFAAGAPAVVITGAANGDEAGASVVVGDFTGDGKDDLVIGAPGANDSRGAVYVIAGRSASTWPRVITLGAADGISVVLGASAGDRFGSAVALADLGNGKRTLLVGAPGSGSVYRFDLLAELTGETVGKPAAQVGSPGSGFGRALSASSGYVAVSALLAAEDKSMPLGAVYVWNASTFGQSAILPARWLGAGGGFGATLAFAQVGRAPGTATLVVSAPSDGAGAIYLRAASDLANGSMTPARWLRAAMPFGQVGSGLAVAPAAVGDSLLLGAPARLVHGSNGAVIALRTATLVTTPTVTLDANGHPSSMIISDDIADEGLGAAIAVGDFDQDGRRDVAIATSDVNKIYLVSAPQL